MHLLCFLRGIAQPGSAPALGAGCREFESLYPDHLKLLHVSLVLAFLCRNEESQEAFLLCSGSVLALAEDSSKKLLVRANLSVLRVTGQSTQTDIY